MSRQRLSSGQRFEAQLLLLSAVSAANAGHGVKAATIYEKLLTDSPDNQFLQVLAQEQTFWLGAPLGMRSLVETAALMGTEAHNDFGAFLSLRAFANEEAGYFKEAEYYGKAAVELDPSDVWGRCVWPLANTEEHLFRTRH